MKEQVTGKPRRNRVAAGVGLLAAGAIGGAALAGTVSASASPATSSAALTGYAATVNPATAPHGRGHGGSGPVHGDEKSPSTTTAATLRAAALKAVPGGSVYRVESDAGDGVYEAHMTKADGSLVTVKFDKFLKVTKVEAGMGTGDPAPAGQAPGGTPPGTAPTAAV